jgi:hypothetical protein
VSTVIVVIAGSNNEKGKQFPHGFGICRKNSLIDTADEIDSITAVHIMYIGLRLYFDIFPFANL